MNEPQNGAALGMHANPSGLTPEEKFIPVFDQSCVDPEVLTRLSQALEQPFGPDTPNLTGASLLADISQSGLDAQQMVLSAIELFDEWRLIFKVVGTADQNETARLAAERLMYCQTNLCRTMAQIGMMHTAASALLSGRDGDQVRSAALQVDDAVQESWQMICQADRLADKGKAPPTRAERRRIMRQGPPRS